MQFHQINTNPLVNAAFAPLATDAQARMTNGRILVVDAEANSVSPMSNGSLPSIPGASLDEIERYAILKTLEACAGSTSQAARMLGISVRKIQYKLRQYRPLPNSQNAAVDGEERQNKAAPELGSV